MRSIVNNPWDFACYWYREEAIRQGIQAARDITSRYHNPELIPQNIDSPEFVSWLTEQYRLAMTKGAQLAISEMRDTANDLSH